MSDNCPYKSKTEANRGAEAVSEGQKFVNNYLLTTSANHIFLETLKACRSNSFTPKEDCKLKWTSGVSQRVMREAGHYTAA